MQKPRYLLIICLLIAPMAVADSYRCQAEQRTTLKGSPDNIEAVESTPTSATYVIENNVLQSRPFALWPDTNCLRDDIGSTRCTHDSGTFEFRFLISRNLFFSIVERNQLGSSHFVYITMGSCEVLEQSD